VQASPLAAAAWRPTRRQTCQRTAATFQRKREVEVSVFGDDAVLPASVVSLWAATLSTNDAVSDVLSSEVAGPPPDLEEPPSEFWDPPVHGERLLMA
jgi:hypothetical protein